MGNIKIRSVLVSECYTNCYLCMNTDTKEGFIVDPGDDALKISVNVSNIEMIPKAILLTHGHGDHIGGVQDIVDAYQVPVYIHKGDVPYLSDPELNLSAYSNPTPIKVKAEIIEVKQGDHITCGDIDLEVLETPGHTPGGVCYYMEGLVFVGDTLFRDSVGRTDFPNGSYETLMESIKTQLYKLPDNTMVYPGHGPETNIGYEKQYNPFVGV